MSVSINYPHPFLPPSLPAWREAKCQRQNSRVTYEGSKLEVLARSAQTNSGIDKVETNMERQQHQCQFLNKTDAFPCPVHLSARL